VEKITRDGVNIRMFDSAAEFANAAKPHGRGSGWGGCSADEAYTACTKGDLSCVGEAEMMIDKISAGVETERSVWVPAVCGAYPIVADYLTGHPFNMRRRTHIQNENAPIRIYIDLTSSAGVHEQQLAKRGVAFLALAMLLTRSRPVEMHAFAALGPATVGRSDREQSGIVTLRLPTAPLDIAIAGGVFTKGIARVLGYEFLHAECGTGPGWLKAIQPFKAEGQRRYVETVRSALNAGPEDVIIGPIHYSDETVNDPVGFVQKMIDQHAKGDGE
jgi:hypothetical protein